MEVFTYISIIYCIEFKDDITKYLTYSSERYYVLCSVMRT